MLFDKDEDDAEDEDQANDELDLDSLARINRALSSVGLRNLHLKQGQGHGRSNEDVSERRRGNHSRPLQQSNQRKTRLSWEAHPSLLLHEMLLELELEE